MIFSPPAGNSRRQRRLKRTGANAPVLTGAWGRSATNKHAPGIYRRIACCYSDNPESVGNTCIV